MPPIDEILTIEPPPACGHLRPDGAHSEEHTGLVHSDDAIPVVDLGLGHRRPEQDAGVVDEHVDVVHVADDALDNAIPLLGRRHVVLEEGAPDRRGGRFPFVDEHVGDVDSRAFGCEECGFGCALSPGSTGDQRDLLLEASHGGCPFTFVGGRAHSR